MPSPLEGPEGLTVEELDKMFDNFDREQITREEVMESSSGPDTEINEVYSFKKLEYIDKDQRPTEDEGEVGHSAKDRGDGRRWDIGALLAAQAVVMS